MVTATALSMILLELADGDVRHFWATHTFTADTVGGLLVLALTVLVVNQVLQRRQFSERSRAVAANAGIMVAQARRSVEAVTSARDAGGDTNAASDEVRTYMMTLLVGAPVLMEDPVARHFLEVAQTLAAELARVLAPAQVSTLIGEGPAGGLDEAVDNLRVAARPLLTVLSPAEQAVVTDDGTPAAPTTSQDV